MQGRISSTSGVRLPDLLQFLGQTQQTGCLVLTSGEFKASINLQNGQVLNARFREWFDEAALAAIMGVPSWRFTLESRVRNSEARIQTPMHTLLLQCSVYADEGAEQFDLTPRYLPFHLDLQPTPALEAGLESLRFEVEFLTQRVDRLCRLLNRARPRAVVFVEGTQAIAYRFWGDQRVDGVIGVNTQDIAALLEKLDERT
ncbi:MAG: DUF4388 domain-containing protein [Verrucomicrobia bacterium]|nr:DUF4388 domain-containing protein [Verrucomicrobiota bacterium]